MKFVITFKSLDADQPVVPVVVDEADMTSETDWAGFMKLGMDRVKETL